MLAVGNIVTITPECRFYCGSINQCLRNCKKTTEKDIKSINYGFGQKLPNSPNCKMAFQLPYAKNPSLEGREAVITGLP